MLHALRSGVGSPYTTHEGVYPLGSLFPPFLREGGEYMRGVFYRPATLSINLIHSSIHQSFFSHSHIAWFLQTSCLLSVCYPTSLWGWVEGWGGFVRSFHFVFHPHSECLCGMWGNVPRRCNIFAEVLYRNKYVPMGETIFVGKHTQSIS